MFERVSEFYFVHFVCTSVCVCVREYTFRCVCVCHCLVLKKVLDEGNVQLCGVCVTGKST